MRLLLGMGEAVSYPSYSKIIAGNYGERHRGIANSWIDAGSKCGPAIGNLVGGLTVVAFGWRALFVCSDSAACSGSVPGFYGDLAIERKRSSKKWARQLR